MIEAIVQLDGGVFRRRRDDGYRVDGDARRRAATKPAMIRHRSIRAREPMRRNARTATAPTWSIRRTSTRLAPVSRRQSALRHHGKARQERQDAALGDLSERRGDRRHLGLLHRAGGVHEGLACSVCSSACPCCSGHGGNGAADARLSVCLDEDLPPLSAHQQGQARQRLRCRARPGCRRSARPAAENPVV